MIPTSDQLGADSLRRAALAAFVVCIPGDKVSAVQSMRERMATEHLHIDAQEQFDVSAHVPGRPDRPMLVDPLDVGRRSMRTPEGRAALIHALAHIEFNAINLALDAIWRFPGMPDGYYLDWLKVAAEEAYHFSLLVDHLAQAGFEYGDFSAHNSLWDMAARTSDDPLARMALVPRTLEARGLDATPAVRAKLAQAGDQRAAEILDIILHDEIGHVAIGNRWFGYLCAQRGLDPIEGYRHLASVHRAPPLRGPFNLEARRLSGFSPEEMQVFESWKP